MQQPNSGSTIQCTAGHMVKRSKVVLLCKWQLVAVSHYILWARLLWHETSQSWNRMQQQHATTVNCRTSGHTRNTLDTGVSSSGICLQKSYQSADNATTHTSVNCLNIRSHARDVYLGMYPVQNGVSYLNVLAHFGETSRTVAKKNNWRPWISVYQTVKDRNVSKSKTGVHVRRKRHMPLLPHFVFSYSYSSSHWIFARS